MLLNYYYLFLFLFVIINRAKVYYQSYSVSPTNQLSVSAVTTVTTAVTTPLQSQLNNDGQCNFTSYSDTSGSFECHDDNDCPPLSLQNIIILCFLHVCLLEIILWKW